MAGSTDEEFTREAVSGRRGVAARFTGTDLSALEVGFEAIASKGFVAAHNRLGRNRPPAG